MKRFLVCLILGFLALSCTRSEIPKDVLPQKKMLSVMWDLMLADEMANYYVQKDTTLHNLDAHAALYQRLFRIQNITREDFKKSLRFYESRPDLLKPIFDSLQRRAEKITVGKMPVS